MIKIIIKRGPRIDYGGDLLYELPYGIEKYVKEGKYRAHDRYFCTKNGDFIYEDINGEFSVIDTWIEDGQKLVKMFDKIYPVYRVLLYAKFGKIDLLTRCKDKMNPTMDNVYYEFDPHFDVMKISNNMIMINETEFKQHPEFSKIYVSRNGMLYNKNKKELMAQTLSDKLYRRIYICEKGNDTKRYLHQLVYETWVEYPIPENMQIDHIYSKSMNGVMYLRLVTHEENVKYAKEAGCYDGKYRHLLEEIIKLLDQGKRPFEIAVKLGYDMKHPDYDGICKFVSNVRSKKIYSNITKDHKFPEIDRSRPVIYSDEEVHAMCEMIQDRPDLTLREIARRFGIDKTFIVDLKNKERRIDICSQYDFSDRGSKKISKPIPKETVKLICEDIVKMELKIVDIAKKYGVSREAIQGIYHRKNHKDVSKDYDFPEHYVVI